MARTRSRSGRVKIGTSIDRKLYDLIWNEHHESDIAISRLIDKAVRLMYGVPKEPPPRRNGGKAG